jgi:hypothetical protein
MIDRRCQILNVTDEGRRVINEIVPMLERAQDRLLAPLGPDEQIVFLSLLSKIVKVNNVYSRVPLDQELYDVVKERVDRNVTLEESGILEPRSRASHSARR